MHDNLRKPNYRKLVIGALIAAVGLALCTGIVFAAIGVFRTFQDGRQSFDTLQDALQESPKKAEEVSRPDPEVRQAILPAHQEVSQEVLMVGIVPAPRIVRLQDVGDSQQLSVQGYYSDGSVRKLEIGPGTAVSYMSSDSSVARVDSEGVVTGVKAAGADVVVRYVDFRATVPIFVWGPVRSVPPYDTSHLLEVAEDGSAVVLNRIMAELGAGYGSADAKLVASSIGGKVVFQFETFSGYLVEFEARSQEELKQALTVLRAYPQVVRAYPDMVVPVSNGDDHIPETLSLRDAKNLAYLDVGMEGAWRMLNRVDKLHQVNIAIIDTGFVRPPTGSQETDRVLNAEFDYDRFEFHGSFEQSHGTAVASVIAARNNQTNKGRNCDLMEFALTFDCNSFSGVVTSVDGIDYGVAFYTAGKHKETTEIDNDAITSALTSISQTTNALETISKYRGQFDVVNMSIAGPCYKMFGPGDGGDACGYIESWVKLMKGMSDVTFVFGAGNEREDGKYFIPAAFTLEESEGWLPPGLPSGLSNVITVGATTKINGRWELTKDSNFGDAITLGASGKDVIVVDPGTGYGVQNGTSYSAPLVTGTVALMKAINPRLNPSDIKGILVETGGSHPVCNKILSEAGACPQEDLDYWAILDAESAVERVIRDATNGSILHASVSRESSKSLDVTVTVRNTGSVNWGFRVDAVDTCAGDRVLDSAINSVSPINHHPFKLRFPRQSADEVGIRLYRHVGPDEELDSTPLAIPLVSEALTPPTVATPTPTLCPIGTPTPTPYRLPDTDVFLLRQAFIPSQSVTSPYAFDSRPFSEWPEPMAVVRRGTNFVVWAFTLDVTQEGEDFQMDGFVRWVDVTYPAHPLVMTESPVRLVEDFGAEAVEVPRSRVVPSEIDTEQNVRYRTQWHSLGHQNEPSLWQPGLYQVQLLDDHHQALFYWQFEVR